MSQRAREPLRPEVPPLEHGDRLDRAEFDRRWEAMPELKRAERLNGMVYLVDDYPSHRIDASIPRFRTGDRLQWDEFERRCENMPDLKRAELINGEVFLSPPVSATNHGIPHSELMFWLMTYQRATPGTAVPIDSTWRLPDGGGCQPDAILMILPSHGGGAGFDRKGYVTGRPELVAEVAASTASYDLNVKLDAYRKNGAREYVVWRTFDRAIDWYVLIGEAYRLLPAREDGLLQSATFPGLWLNARALLDGDIATATRVAQEGLASPEHTAFVNRLRNAAAAAAEPK